MAASGNAAARAVCVPLRGRDGPTIGASGCAGPLPIIPFQRRGAPCKTPVWHRRCIASYLRTSARIILEPTSGSYSVQVNPSLPVSPGPWRCPPRSGGCPLFQQVAPPPTPTQTAATSPLRFWHSTCRSPRPVTRLRRRRRKAGGQSRALLSPEDLVNEQFELPRDSRELHKEPKRC